MPLSPDTPRDVVWSGSYIALLSVPLALLAFLYSVFAVPMGQYISHYNALAARGVEVAAEITGEMRGHHIDCPGQCRPQFETGFGVGVS